MSPPIIPANPPDGLPSTPASGAPLSGTLVLSPHSDDAALSVGGVVAGRLLPAPLRVLTLFGRSHYTREGGFGGDVEKVTALRIREDRAWSRTVGARLESWTLPEALLRPDEPSIFAEATMRAPREPVPRWLRAPLSALLRNTRPKVVAVPLGLGDHRDHLQTRRAAIDGIATLPASLRPRLVFYEDLPYASRLSEGGIRSRVAAVDPGLRPVWLRLGDALGAKIDALRCYPSQLEEEDLRAVRRHALRWSRLGLGPCERLWSVAPPGSWLRPGMRNLPPTPPRSSNPRRHRGGPT